MPDTDVSPAQIKANEVLARYPITLPPVPVYDIARQYGLSVHEFTFSNDFSDIAGYIDIADNTIALNSADMPAFKTFAVAYELGLWLLYKDELQTNSDLSILRHRPIGTAGDNPRENEADVFAAYLMMPDKFWQEYDSISQKNDHVGDSNLAIIFGVPADLIVFRRKLFKQADSAKEESRGLSFRGLLSGFRS